MIKLSESIDLSNQDVQTIILEELDTLNLGILSFEFYGDYLQGIVQSSPSVKINGIRIWTQPIDIIQFLSDGYVSVPNHEKVKEINEIILSLDKSIRNRKIQSIIK